MHVLDVKGRDGGSAGVVVERGRLDYQVCGRQRNRVEACEEIREVEDVLDDVARIHEISELAIFPGAQVPEELLADLEPAAAG